MSSSAQNFVPPLDIGRTFGALFIGVIIAAVLFGLSNVQAFIYFQTHKDTGMTFYKLAVIWLWILDALHLALIVHCIYYHLVINYANFDALIEIIWSSKLSVVIEVLIIFSLLPLSHMDTKGKSRILPITVGIVIVLSSGVATALIWFLYQLHTSSDLIKIVRWIYMALGTLGTVTFSDIVITSSLCYLLATSRTGFPSTDSLITKLMVYIIHTGCLTRYSSFQTIPYLDLYFMQCMFDSNYNYVTPTNLVFIAIDFLLAKGIVKAPFLESC
ncbi:hypothetical protein BDR07DRAFT_1489602 [Suillus spraguei]|nr:hypothetical protein BDR07DRAFT_1489602 [Suillus spraguei]